ncbi:MAG: hypothetical protein K6G57_03635 [Lachnospiraceae bacterium]|nr:hypothetical protein [Lachnospiraceae bacterium]
MDKDVEIVTDCYGRKIVRINCIRFSGKRSINWDEVKRYLKDYIDRDYTIIDTNDVVFLGKDLPDEYTGSKDTYRLRGTLAKAKANAAQGLGEMLEISSGREYTTNRKEKHNVDAANGWYRYTTRFALPVFGDGGKIERYNVFRGYMIVRHDQNGKKYLYDLIDIKKETSNPPSCQN